MVQFLRFLRAWIDRRRALREVATSNLLLRLLSRSIVLSVAINATSAIAVGNGTVLRGQATIEHEPNRTVINQGSARAVINWQNFNVDSGQTVEFKQPNANAATLNQVIDHADGARTKILGTINANGRVFIVDPNGIVFGKGAQVNVGGLVASSLKIDPDAFMAAGQSFAFKAAPGYGAGVSVERGAKITAKSFVSLLGASAYNAGRIEAGTDPHASTRGISMTAADGATIRLDNFVVTLDALSKSAMIENSGDLIVGESDGNGSVLLNATGRNMVMAAMLVNRGSADSQTGDAVVTNSGNIRNESRGADSEISLESGSSLRQWGSIEAAAGRVDLHARDIGLLGKISLGNNNTLGPVAINIGGVGTQTVVQGEKSIISAASKSAAKIAIEASGQLELAGELLAPNGEISLDARILNTALLIPIAAKIHTSGVETVSRLQLQTADGLYVYLGADGKLYAANGRKLDPSARLYNLERKFVGIVSDLDLNRAAPHKSGTFFSTPQHASQNKEIMWRTEFVPLPHTAHHFVSGGKEFTTVTYDASKQMFVLSGQGGSIPLAKGSKFKVADGGYEFEVMSIGPTLMLKVISVGAGGGWLSSRSLVKDGLVLLTSASNGSGVVLGGISSGGRCLIYKNGVLQIQNTGIAVSVDVDHGSDMGAAGSSRGYVVSIANGGGAVSTIYGVPGILLVRGKLRSVDASGNLGAAVELPNADLIHLAGGGTAIVNPVTHVVQHVDSEGNATDSDAGERAVNISALGGILLGKGGVLLQQLDPQRLASAIDGAPKTMSGLPVFASRGALWSYDALAGKFVPIAVDAGALVFRGHAVKFELLSGKLLERTTGLPYDKVFDANGKLKADVFAKNVSSEAGESLILASGHYWSYNAATKLFSHPKYVVSNGPQSKPNEHGQLAWKGGGLDVFRDCDGHLFVYRIDARGTKWLTAVKNGTPVDAAATSATLNVLVDGRSVTLHATNDRIVGAAGAPDEQVFEEVNAQGKPTGKRFVYDGVSGQARSISAGDLVTKASQRGTITEVPGGVGTLSNPNAQITDEAGKVRARIITARSLDGRATATVLVDNDGQQLGADGNRKTGNHWVSLRGGKVGVLVDKNGKVMVVDARTRELAPSSLTLAQAKDASGAPVPLVVGNDGYIWRPNAHQGLARSRAKISFVKGERGEAVLDVEGRLTDLDNKNLASGTPVMIGRERALVSPIAGGHGETMLIVDRAEGKRLEVDVSGRPTGNRVLSTDRPGEPDLLVNKRGQLLVSASRKPSGNFVVNADNGHLEVVSADGYVHRWSATSKSFVRTDDRVIEGRYLVLDVEYFVMRGSQRLKRDDLSVYLTTDRTRVLVTGDKAALHVSAMRDNVVRKSTGLVLDSHLSPEPYAELRTPDGGPVYKRVKSSSDGLRWVLVYGDAAGRELADHQVVTRRIFDGLRAAMRQAKLSGDSELLAALAKAKADGEFNGASGTNERFDAALRDARKLQDFIRLRKAAASTRGLDRRLEKREEDLASAKRHFDEQKSIQELINRQPTRRPAEQALVDRMNGKDYATLPDAQRDLAALRRELLSVADNTEHGSHAGHGEIGISKPHLASPEFPLDAVGLLDGMAGDRASGEHADQQSYVNAEDIVVDGYGVALTLLHVHTATGKQVYRRGDGRITTDIHGGRLAHGEVLLNDKGVVLNEYGDPKRAG